jgi:transcriptional regulator with XRE-family HTH domain
MLQFWIRQKGISQKDLAKRAGVSQGAINKYTRGIRFPDYPMLLKIAGALGISPVDLFNHNPGVQMDVPSLWFSAKTEMELESLQSEEDESMLINPTNPCAPKKPTKCWDCALATGSVDIDDAGRGCPWARRLRPVPGWEATETKIKFSTKMRASSYIVHKCPLFVRDSFNGGMSRRAKR